MRTDGRDVRQRGRDLIHRHTQMHRYRSSRQRIHNVMLTANAQGDLGMLAITIVQNEARMVQFVAMHMLRADCRLAVIVLRKSEPHHVARSDGAHRSHMLVIRVQYGKTTWNKTTDDFRFGLCDAFRRAEFP